MSEPGGRYANRARFGGIRWGGGSVLVLALAAGPASAQQLLQQHVCRPTLSDATMPIIVSEGMRAVSVRVHDVIGGAGPVNRRARVDVLMEAVPPAGRRGPVSRTLLRNVQVLACSQSTKADPAGQPAPGQVVTLAVTPEQSAEIMQAAKHGGRIRLASRSAVRGAPSPTAAEGTCDAL